MLRKLNHLLRFDKDISEADVATLKDYKYHGSDYTWLDNQMNKFWFAAVEYLPTVTASNEECGA